MIVNTTGSPVGDSLFVEMPSALQDSIIMPKSGVEIFLPSHLSPEKYATCQGVVHSIGPRNNLGLQPGDTIALSYMLVADYEQNADGDRSYNRAHVLGDKVLWLTDSWMAMAVLRDEEWQALGDWVIMEEIAAEAPVSTLIIIPDSIADQKVPSAGKLISGSDAPAGSTVHFPEKHRSLYTFPNGKTYIILKEESILAYS